MGNGMRTLIIHPQDPTTTFLKKAYEGLKPDTGLMRSSAPRGVDEALSRYDRAVMLGHGTPNGLLGVGMFHRPYAISELHVSALIKGSENIYIWCNADQFVQRHNLKSPLYSGMFVSEMGEALMMGINDVVPDDVEESNYLFANVLNKMLKEHDMSHIDMYSKYHRNPVIRYNANRLYSR
jgi:hypothetical protein